MSSGERKRRSLNQGACSLGLRDPEVISDDASGSFWKGAPERVTAPYAKCLQSLRASQVGRDT